MSDDTNVIDVDFSDLKPVDVEPIEEGTPNFKASKSKSAFSDLFKPRDNEPTSAPKPKPRGRPKSTAPAYRAGQFVQPLTQMYMTMGLMLMPIDKPVAEAVIQQAEACAKSLDELAKQNESVRKALITLTTTGAWGAVMVAHAPILIAVMVNHVPAVRERLAVFAPGTMPESENVS